MFRLLGDVKVRVVEQVIALHPQHQPQVLMQLLGLLEDRIRIHEPRPMELITPEGNVLAEGRIGKCTRRRSRHDAAGDELPAARWVWLAHKLRPIRHPGMQVVHVSL